MWDRQTGEPVYNAIVWQDRRTADRCDTLKADGIRGPRAAAHRAGDRRLLLRHASSPGSSTTSPARARRRRTGRLAFGTVDSWLVWKLTGGRVHVTDVSNASRTMLFNIHTLKWDEELLAHARRPRQPAARGPRLERGVRARLRRPRPRWRADGGHRGRPAGGPVRPDVRDSRAWRRTPTAPAASCCRTPASGPSRPANRLLTTVAWQVGGRTEYALEGSVFIGGAVVQWLRDGLGLIRTRRTSSASRRPCPTTAASTSCRPSRASARRTGTPTRAARSSASRAASTAGHIARAAAREHRLPGRRPARRDAARRRDRAGRTARRRRRRRATTC